MIRIHKLACGVASSALLLALGTAAVAQETTSAIRGAVTDDAGQPVGAAQITIIHLPSGTRSVVTSDDDGGLDARGLRVGGPYSIAVEAAGYEPETLEGVNLTVAETLRLNLDLAPEGTVDAVVVTAVRDPSADNTGVSSTLGLEQVQSVVSVQRDIRDLARRNILVSQNTRGDQGISIAGSNPRTNRITIDGSQAQDDFGLNTGGQPTRRGPVSLDAIEQFSVTAVPLDVENGDFLGGALDVVLRSGQNDFDGSFFVNYLNDGLVGDSLRGNRIGTQITQQNYGAFLAGPILRDRLFFALSYELYESAEATQTGPTGAGFANSIRNTTQANIDALINTFNTSYASDFDTGQVVRTTPIRDEKYTAKLDWNINDNHRASLSQRYNLSETYSRTNLSQTSAGLSSQYYLTGEEVYSYAFELNSDWTNNLSTQLRITHNDYERRQDPPSGQEFAEVIVCNTPTSGGVATTCDAPSSPIRFGPDEFRQANFLETANTQIQAKAEYSAGDHLLKIGYQGQKVDVFNLFVAGSDGVYYFDSVADFAAGRANQLRYNNSVTGDANDAAADFRYTVHSLLAQDTWEVTEQLRLTGGVRYDFYTSDDIPPLNPNFVARNGFNNQETYDGLSVLMPRIGLEYEPFDWLEINTGVGLFSGGLPDVFLSNSFSNTGILTAGVDIRRAGATFTEQNGTPGFTQATGAAALNLSLTDPNTFYTIPTAVQALQGGAVVPPLSETNAITPDFKMPSDWKFFISSVIEAPDGWSAGFAPAWAQPVLDNWRLSLDAVITRVNDGLSFRDFRAKPLVVNGVQQFTPDGRIRYDNIGGTAVQRAAQGITSMSAGGGNRDIIAINDDQGEAYTAGFTLSRQFENGLDLTFGYARQNVDDIVSGARFSSTASSLYGTGPAGLDPNQEQYGTSFEEVRNRYKLELSYAKRFFGDYETRFNMFGEVRDGRPVSYVMDVPGGGRSTTFGVNRANHLLYVPNFAADANPNDLTVGFVTFADQNTLNNMRAAIDLFGLPQGQIVEKGSGTDNPEIYQLDLQVSQALPGLRNGHNTRISFDIQNVLNLLNDEWGLVEEYTDTNRVVSAACAVPGAGGAFVAAAATDPRCSGYVYSNFNPGSLTKAFDNNGRSQWQMQISLRYEF